MDTNTFNDVVNHQIELSTSVLIKKAGEYATGDDRLHNFRIAAALRETTMRDVLGGMMLKHTVSVYDLINMKTVPSEEYVEEKLGDHINYLLLLKAVLEEEREDQLVEEISWTPGWYMRPEGVELPEYVTPLPYIVEAVTHNQAEQLVGMGYERMAEPDQRRQDVKKRDEENEAKSLQTLREKLSDNPGGPGWYRKNGFEELILTYKQAEEYRNSGWVFVRGIHPNDLAKGVKVEPDNRLGWYKKDGLEILVEDAGTRRRYQDLGWTFDREYGSDHADEEKDNAPGWYSHTDFNTRKHASSYVEGAHLVEEGWTRIHSVSLAHDGS